MKVTTLFATTILALAMLAPVAMAQEAGAPAPGAPPAAAHPELHAMFKARLDACTGKLEGDSCTFAGRDNESKTGVCRKTPRGKLICGRPRHPGGAAAGGVPHPNTPGE